MRADIAVIGLGAIGSAAIFELSRRGAMVAGFDAFDPPHAHGSSHGDTRLVRIAYAEGEAYVPLARRAVALWGEANAAAGEALFHQDGVLYVGPEDGTMIAGVRKSADRFSIALETVETAWSVRVPRDWISVFEPEGGYARPEAAISFYLKAAASAGAQIRRNSPVDSMERVPGGWRIKAAGRVWSADKVLLTAGGWTGTLQPALAPLLSIERRVHTWFAPEDTGMVQGRHPAFAFQDETGRWFYGAPALVGGRGVKLSPHHANDPAPSPDTVNRSTSEADSEAARAFAARVLPGLGAVIDREACFYTMSPDGHFIIEDSLKAQGLFTVCGLSGHGFKFAPALGEYAALRLLGGDVALDLTGFSPARFQ